MTGGTRAGEGAGIRAGPLATKNTPPTAPHSHTQILLVGARQFMAHGAHGAADHVVFRHVASVGAAREYLHARGASLVGVEIDDASHDVTQDPWTGPVGFLMGNEVREGRVVAWW